MSVGGKPQPSFVGETATSLSDRAYERLLDMIVQRELPADTVLQERPLAEFLKISRTPLRQALNRLESEGLLERSPGRALVVKKISPRELIEALHVRMLLEVEAISLAIGRIPAEAIDAVEADVRSLLERPNASGAEDWEVDSAFHGLIARASGNRVLAEMIEALRLRTHMFNVDRVPERFVIGHEEHLAMLDALRRGDEQAARSGMQSHIANVKASILQKLGEV